MIRDLDDTLEALLQGAALPGSELADADIAFDLPNGAWRGTLTELTVNCYLYDVQENRELRSNEPRFVRSADTTRAQRIRPPVRVDCAYCITAWSPSVTTPVLEEHRLLSQVLTVLLRNPIIPGTALRGSLTTQTPPYPTLIASPSGIKNPPEFWGALDQQLKPSLNYVITLAYELDPVLPDPAKSPVAVTVGVGAFDLSERP